MSVGFTSVGEEAISGQKTLEPSSTVPNGVIVYSPTPDKMKTVTQTWPDNATQQVFSGSSA